MLKELKAKRGKVLDCAKEIVALAEKEKRDITEAELKEIAKLRQDAERLKATIQELESLDSDLAGLNEPSQRRSQPGSFAGDPTALRHPPEQEIRQRQVGRLTNFQNNVDGRNSAMRFGLWFMALLGNKRAQGFCKNNGLEFSALSSEATNSAGGYLVPEEFDATIIDLREVYGVARRVAKVVPMARDVKKIPRRTGGLTAYFLGEGAAITESTKAWDSVSLVAKKIGVLSRFTSELNEDSAINIGDDLAGEIAYAMAVLEDNCMFNGDGSSTYGGITGFRQKILGLSATRANIAGLSVGANTTWAAAVLTEFENVLGLLPQYADVPGEVYWICHRAFFYNVMVKLALAAGGVTSTEMQGGARVPMFLGYPVVFSQQMPKVTAVDDIPVLFGNFKLASKLGDRRQLSIALSDEASVGGQSMWERDEIGIRGIERADIVVHDVGNASATVALQVPGPVTAFATHA